MGSNPDWELIHFGRLPPGRQAELLEASGQQATEFLDVVHEIAGGQPADPEKAKLRARLVKAFRIEGVSATLDEEQLDELLEPIDAVVLFGADGQPIEPESNAVRQLICDATFVEKRLLEQLADGRAAFTQLHPRRFEEVVAEIFARLGYEVQLTAPSRDGGKDIVIARRGDHEPRVFFVECKRYRPPRRVEVGVVRQLYGVIKLDGAAKGIVAASTLFTRDAKETAGKVEGELLLADYLELHRWLHQALAPDTAGQTRPI